MEENTWKLQRHRLDIISQLTRLTSDCFKDMLRSTALTKRGEVKSRLGFDVLEIALRSRLALQFKDNPPQVITDITDFFSGLYFEEVILAETFLLKELLIFGEITRN